MGAAAAVLLAVPARAEWQVSAGLGNSFTDRSDLHIQQGGSQYTVDGVGWSGRGFQMPPWYDLRATYYLPSHPGLGITAGLLHMKVYARTGEDRRIHGTDGEGGDFDTTGPMDDYVQKYNISHGVNYLEFGVVGRLFWQRDAQFPDGRILPYAGVTLGPVINHPENRVGGEPNDADYHKNPGWGTQALIGVQYKMSKRWGLYSEVKRTHVSSEVPIADGKGKTTLNSTHVGGGVVYSF
jgi:lipid A oxidase